MTPITQKGSAMIISKFGKTYDTSDGSEQPFGAAVGRPANRLQSARAQWEDDGGPVLQVIAPLIVGRKPAWSELSLKDLNEALRRASDPNDPVRVHEESQQQERAQANALARTAAQAAAADLALRDRYRNAWETS